MGRLLALPFLQTSSFLTDETVADCVLDCTMPLLPYFGQTFFLFYTAFPLHPLLHSFHLLFSKEDWGGGIASSSIKSKINSSSCCCCCCCSPCCDKLQFEGSWHILKISIQEVNFLCVWRPITCTAGDETTFLAAKPFTFIWIREDSKIWMDTNACKIRQSQERRAILK